MIDLVKIGFIIVAIIVLIRVKVPPGCPFFWPQRG
jgi:hypothetical protein